MSNKALQPGARVLITGANGYIASHIADQLLQLGYRVRGTARTQEKVDMIGKTLQERHPDASFEGYVLSDVTEKGVWEKAMQDCDGVVHTATDVSFDSNPYNVVPAVVLGVKNIVAAAERSGTVTRFVYTSSSTAAVRPTPNTKFHVDSNSWNQADVDDAWAPPPYSPERSFAVYSASKTEGERAGWEFMKENRRFVLNTVLPNFTLGPRLNDEIFGSTSGWTRGLFNNIKEDVDMVLSFPPQYNVDVRDVARIHVAALLESDVKSERLFAFAEPFNFSRIVSTLKKIDPSRDHYPPPPENEGEDLSTVDNVRAAEMLKRMGRAGFIGMEESLRDQLERN